MADQIGEYSEFIVKGPFKMVFTNVDGATMTLCTDARTDVEFHVKNSNDWYDRMPQWVREKHVVRYD